MNRIDFSIRPCIAMVVRHLYEFKNPLEAFTFAFWSSFDILSFGLLAASFNKPGSVQIITVNIALWYLVGRSTTGFAISFVRELHNANFVSILTTPITRAEWIVSLMCMGIIQGLLSCFVSALSAWLFFGASFFSVGWLLLPVAISLLFSGLIQGLFAISTVLTFGRRAETLVWVFIFFLAPFSGVFHPVSGLPIILQKIAAWLPMSYVYASLLDYNNSWILLSKSFGLNLFYFVLALLLFHWCFAKRREIGITRLELEI